MRLRPAGGLDSEDTGRIAFAQICCILSLNEERWVSVRGAWTRLLFTPLPTTPFWIIDPASKRWLSAQASVDGQAVSACACHGHSLSALACGWDSARGASVRFNPDGVFAAVFAARVTRMKGINPMSSKPSKETSAKPDKSQKPGLPPMPQKPKPQGPPPAKPGQK